MKFTLEKESKLYLLLGLYVGALYAANLLGGKLMPIGFGDRGLSVSIVTFPFLFLITDIVGEVYGKKKGATICTDRINYVSCTSSVASIFSFSPVCITKSMV